MDINNYDTGQIWRHGGGDGSYYIKSVHGKAPFGSVEFTHETWTGFSTSDRANIVEFDKIIKAGEYVQVVRGA